jgi:acyl carrier protein
MPTHDDVVQRLLEYLEPMADPGMELTRDTNLVTTLSLDSQKIMDLLLDVEDDFDVLVPMEALVDVETVDELATVIHRRIEEE